LGYEKTTKVMIHYHPYLYESRSVGATGACPHVANRHVSDSLPFAEWSWANSARRLAAPARPPLRSVPPILLPRLASPAADRDEPKLLRLGPRFLSPPISLTPRGDDAIGGAAGSNCGAPTRSASAGPAGGLGRGLPSGQAGCVGESRHVLCRALVAVQY
jgi:hypothetical protein